MLKKSAISLFILGAILGFQSCNSDDDSQLISEDNVAASSVLVSAFSLTADDSVLVNLDTVFFSIDQKNARIFNADSLPYGTKISRLIPKITYSTVSVAELSYKRPDGTDSIVDYLKNSTDSIDFANGDVKFRLVSYDGATQRTYSISVNVHKLKPDSLYWNEAAVRRLPTSLTSPTSQKAIEFNGKAYCITTNGEDYCIAVADNPSGNWDFLSPEFTFKPDIATLSCTASSLFILSDAGDLYSSADGVTWTATGESWSNILGGYQDVLLGLSVDGDKYFHVTYPVAEQVEVASGFPIAGFSNPVMFKAEWGLTPQLYVTGGRTESGEVTGHTWGFDGSTWHRISNQPLPVALYGTTIVPFTTFHVNTTDWTVDSYPILLAMGGSDADNQPTKSIYMSYNQGMNWKECTDLMQLPDYMPAFTGAQALLFYSTLTEDDATARSEWTSSASRPLPSWASLVTPAMSRATKPITSWECPYIYIFGGLDSNGHLLDTVWKGTFNRLTFKPIQ